VTLTDDQIHDALSSILERRDPDIPATVLGAGSDDLGAGLRYLEALVDGGWMVPTWPAEHGGRGATDDEARRISTALGDYASADLYPYGVGISLVGPVLRDRGTPEQQDRWLRPIADGFAS
jgi:alkylation response protein AidB-like acyl-CoA dehydrogenase